MHPKWSLRSLPNFVTASEQVHHCVIVSLSTNCCLQTSQALVRSLLKPNRLAVVRIRRSGGFSNVSSSSVTSNARISPFFHFRSLPTSIRSLPRSSRHGEPPVCSAANEINDRDFLAKQSLLWADWLLCCLVYGNMQHVREPTILSL